MITLHGNTQIIMDIITMVSQTRRPKMHIVEMT